MPADHPQQRTQEQSIRARKSQLFDKDELPDDPAAGPRKSLRDCLRETPATPLPPMVKGLLWAVGIVVLLLLSVALATGGGKKEPRAKATSATTAAPAASRPA